MSALEKELSEVRKKNAELEMQNEILKKWNFKGIMQRYSMFA
jgi:transposase-like protein